jgi:hypothetical protein
MSCGRGRGIRWRCAFNKEDGMISVKGLALTMGVLWAACVFLVGVANLLWPTYGVAFLEIPKSIYPGYASTSGFWGVIVGTLYALLDGGILGAVFAWLYNAFRPKDYGPAVIL